MNERNNIIYENKIKKLRVRTGCKLEGKIKINKLNIFLDKEGQ